MNFLGKAIGGFLGFMFIGDHFFSHLLGLFLGVALGHLCDFFVAKYFIEHSDADAIDLVKKQEKQECFFYSVFSVMGHIAKTKGQVTKADIQVANIYLDELHLQGENTSQCEYSMLNALQTAKHRTQEQTAFGSVKETELFNALQTTKHRMQAHSAFSAGQSKDFSLSDTLGEFSQMVNANQVLSQMFLCIQIKMANIDGTLSDKKNEALNNIATHFGFPRAEYNRLLKIIEGQQSFYEEIESEQRLQDEQYVDGPHRILGITKLASEKEIKQAYRKLMSQYHPDKLASKNISEEMMQQTKEKSQRIQNAYEVLRKS